MLIPRRLKEGDAIGVVTPSAPISMSPSPAPFDELEAGLSFLRELGFHVKVGQHALHENGYTAGTPEQRAGDVNAMFADDEVSAIICSHGGFNFNACLPHLDWELIRANTKILMGFSGCTIFLLAFWAKVGLVTFHGNTVIWHFGMEPTEYDRQEFQDRLVRGKIGLVRQNSNWQTVRGAGSVEGRLLGGHLGQILNLAGTPYWPDFRDAILFIEGWGGEAAVMDARLHQLLQMGLFEQINGAVVGHIAGASNYRLEELLAEISSDYDFPILKNDDFGHNCPNTVMPVGVLARLDADRALLEILEPCVR